MKQEKAVFFRVLPVLALTVALMAVIIGGKISRSMSDMAAERETLGRQVTVEDVSFTESSGKLLNPNRGFYHLHGFVIRDEETNYEEELLRRFGGDKETVLTLVEINLREYRDRPISDQGLDNVEKLLSVMEEKLGKQLIIRFLYDWDGKNLETEPDTMDLILEHMRQLEPVLKRYGSQIFTLQGLFVGDCGEMHHSKYLSQEETRVLAEQLAAVTDEATFLSVRTPAHWRRITGISDAARVVREDGTLGSRLGLYNDGMLGSGNDCGTYGVGTLEANGPFVNWKRAEELAFQDVLCSLVPVGGEVILDNPCNDWEAAVADLSVMHVSYLNGSYDKNVLNKWADTIVSEEGCFDGMNGLEYIERHLGYRLVLREAALAYMEDRDVLAVEVAVQNVGFAPIYKAAETELILCHRESGELISCLAKQDVRELTGGSRSEQTLTVCGEFSLEGLAAGRWDAYIRVTDAASGRQILFGNEQDAAEHGYQVGMMELR